MGACGGSATISYAYGAAKGSVSFTVLGQNPTASTVKALLTSPWFVQQLANSESPGYLQFNSSGYPVFGGPNGYGIMMIDFNNTASDLWNWVVNVSDGLKSVSSFGTLATTWWNNQVDAFNAWNAAHTPSAQPPYDTTEGPCTFSSDPSASMHIYSDAVWIKSYNAGPPDSSNAYIVFSAGSGAWSYQPLSTYNGKVWDYVYRVCTTSP